ncbi:hypothetical protein E1H18_2464 [Caulobacter sp. RHG1]|nr:hypothetical protein [Caulobacter sp. RHG1]
MTRAFSEAPRFFSLRPRGSHSLGFTFHILFRRRKPSGQNALCEVDEPVNPASKADMGDTCWGARS